MVEMKSPTIGIIKNRSSLAEARALLTLAVCEVCDFFNVGKNMNPTQVAVTVDIIIDSYSHLKLEEIKYCFRRAMKQSVLFDRLDGNIILGWLAQYDHERTMECVKLSERDDARRMQGQISAGATMSFGEFAEKVRRQAEDGDVGAQDMMSIVLRAEAMIGNSDPKIRMEKDEAFKQWKNNRDAEKEN